VQDTSCPGELGVSPNFNKKSPEYGGFRGLVKADCLLPYQMWYNLTNLRGETYAKRI